MDTMFASYCEYDENRETAFSACKAIHPAGLLFNRRLLDRVSLDCRTQQDKLKEKSMERERRTMEG